MSCGCAAYPDLELLRKNITRRIRETTRIRKGLTLVAEHPDGENSLFRCGGCGQYWQISRAWNWGNDEYAFKVPITDTQEWKQERYAAPDEMLIHTAVITEYIEKNRLTESDRACGEENCGRKALNGMNVCLRHHIDEQVRQKILPGRPEGKLFPPYYSGK